MSEVKKLIETIEKFIPGLKEYKEKELLREEDLKVRELVRKSLQEAESTLRDLEQYMIMTVPNFDPTFFEEQVIQKLETILRKVESAEAGYGGWMSHVNIEEKELMMVLENDRKLLEAVKAFLEDIMKMSDVAKGGEGSVDVIGLSKKLSEIDKYLSARKEILRGGGAE